MSPLIDALTFWRAGFRNVTAAYGVNGFTEEHRAALQEHDVRRVLLAYDRDEAGDKAAAALAERLAADGLGVFRVQFPRGMDVNSYACSTQPAAKALGLVLRAAAWMAGSTERGAERGESGAERAPGGGERRSPAKAPPPASPPLAAGRGEAPEPAEPQAASAEPAAPILLAEPEPPALPEPGAPVDRAFGDRRYRVRGWEENLSYERLRVLVRVARGDVFFVDSVDLVSAKKRRAFLQQAAAELGRQGGSRQGRPRPAPRRARGLPGPADPGGAAGRGGGAAGARARGGARRPGAAPGPAAPGPDRRRLPPLRRRGRGDQQP